MRSKLSAIAARMPSKRGPLAAQSREEPEPYSFPAITTSGTPEKKDRKSTRLNSSHLVISYAVFCLKKKNTRALGRPVAADLGVRRDRAEGLQVCRIVRVPSGEGGRHGPEPGGGDCDGVRRHCGDQL